MSEMRTMTLNGRLYDGFVDNVARSHLAATLVVNSASGDNIVLSDASNFDVVGLKIFGKTIQDGTPTPDNPVELISAGSTGGITVNVAGENAESSMAIATPNGLPGIPVTAGSNYTDANGQQWICDEIDMQGKVRIQRVVKVGNFVLDKTLDVCDVYAAYMPVEALGGGRYPYALCTHSSAYEYHTFDSEHYYVDGRYAWVFVPKGTDCTRLEMCVIRKDPIETPLSTEEQNAYAALHTYRDYSKVSNDAGAYMKLEYVMDAKKYIDSLAIPGGASARLSSVTLSSSAWKTEAENLHSQVVSISGITEYSKVDLLPSVEQLAIFHNKDVAFVTENEDGVVTVFAIGDKPTTDYTMQVSITEVLA